MAMGVPAKIRPGAAATHMITSSVQAYAANAHWYNAELRRIG
jgi:hypothetical protein